jgi:hypothetical protein
MFEDKVISITSSRYRNLKRPATLAASSPDTCVTILNKSAYYVIKDCADLTLKYLPHFIYSGLKDPISKLRGSVIEEEIVDFVDRSTREDHTQQLLRLILDDIQKKKAVITPQFANSKSKIDFSLTGEEGDVYGDYDVSERIEPQVEDSSPPDPIVIDYTDTNTVIDALKSALLSH